MATLGAGCVGLAVLMNRNTAQQAVMAIPETEAEQAAKTAPPAQKRVEDYLVVDPMEMTLGLACCPWPIHRAAVT